MQGTPTRFERRVGRLRRLGRRSLGAGALAGLISLTAVAVEPLASHAGTLPSVTVPSVPVPVVPAPPVSAPPVPSVSVPRVSAPAAPAPPAPAPAASSPSASWPTAVADTVVQATTEGVGFTVSPSGTGPVGNASSVAGHSDRAASRRGHAGSAPFSERYLIRTVSRLRTCLSVIGSHQARALMLRTGIGVRRRHSRRAVARILRVTLHREGQIERKGVTALRTAAAEGFCAGPSHTTGLTAEANETSLLAAELPTPLATRSSPPGKRRELHRRHSTSSRSQQSVSGASAGLPLPLPHPGSSSSDLLLIVLAALLAAAAVLAVLARREMLRSRLAPAGHGVGRAAATVPARRAGAARAGTAAAAAAGATAIERGRRQDTVVRQRVPEDALAAYRAPGVAGDLVAAAGLRGAFAALRRADERGDPAGAAGLGVVLEQQGDIAGALAAYRRADERGNVHGTLRLGALLAARGDLRGAIDAYRRADERGNVAGAARLGDLLERQGDLDGAHAAYRRADERGDARGALSLGSLLERRGDRAGAVSAYRRARERGDEEVARTARTALVRLMGG